MEIGKLKLSNIDFKEDEKLLEMIYLHDNMLELEFSLDLCEMIDMFKYYVNRNIEHVNDLNNYDCIYPEFKYIDGDLLFTLNASEDEEDSSDVTNICKELKRHFGVSLLNCKSEDIFRILLFYCCSYTIEDDIINLNIYYENFKETWLGDYLARLER